MKSLWLCFLMLLLAFQSFVPIEARAKKGQLEIQLSQDAPLDVLTDIKINLTDYQGKHAAFTKSNAKFTDLGNKQILVQLPKLPEGQYLVVFELAQRNPAVTVPSSQIVSVIGGELAKLHQHFALQYGGVRAWVKGPGLSGLKDRVPLITLKDAEGNAVATSDNGNLFAQSLTPGVYDLAFEGIDQIQSPQPMKIHVQAGDLAGPYIGYYGETIATVTQEEPGSLLSAMSVEKRVDFEESALVALKTNSEEFGELEIQSKLPQGVAEKPTIVVKDIEGSVVGYGSQGTLQLKSLRPGQYQVEFGELAELEKPESLVVEVDPKAPSPPVVGAYIPKQGSFVIDYYTDETQVGLEEIKIQLIDSVGAAKDLLKDGRYTVNQETKGRTVRIDGLPIGRYSVNFSTPDSPLFDAVPSQEFTLLSGQVIHIIQPIRPHYGAIDVQIDVMSLGAERTEPLPIIQLLDSRGNVLKKSADGRMQTKNLLPGKYTVSFGDFARHTAPQPLDIELQADEVYGPVLAQYRNRPGSLVVSYATGKAQVRLNQVHFWLIDQDGNREMYPIGNEREQNKELNGFNVRIRDIPTGTYRIEFLVPNTDNLFEAAPTQTVVVSSDEEAQIQQIFSPRYGQLRVALDESSFFDREQPIPTIQLRDLSGNIVANSASGLLSQDELFPGRYQLVFGDYPRHITPEPITVQIEPNKRAETVIARYTPKEGRLVVRYRTDDEQTRLDRIQFWITNKNGERSLHPQETEQRFDNETHTNTATVEGLTVGEYTLDFVLPNADGLFSTAPQYRFFIAPDDAYQIEQTFEPHFGSLRAIINADKIDLRYGAMPMISLVDHSGKIVARTQSGELNAKKLPPGPYTLAFSTVDKHISPAPISFMVEAGKFHGPFVGVYKRKPGKLTVDYFTDEQQTRLNDIRFWLIDENGNRQTFPKEKNFTYNAETHGIRIHLDPIESGAYKLQFLLPNTDQLFEEIDTKEIYIPPEEEVFVSQEIIPRFASVKATVDVDSLEIAGDAPLPKISILDMLGNEIDSSDSGHIQSMRLVPGEYMLVFGDVPKHIAPDKVVVRLEPSQSIGPFQGRYEKMPGKLKVDYFTDSFQVRLSEISLTLVDPKGNRTSYPQDNGYADNERTRGRTVVLEKLPVGEYELIFNIPYEDGLFEPVASRHFRIGPAEEIALTQGFAPHYAQAHIEIDPKTILRGETDPMPKISILGKGGIVADQSTSGRLDAMRLVPGDYEIIFDAYPRLIPPASIPVTVAADQTVGPFVGMYEKQPGKIIVSYATDEERTRLDRIHFWLIDKDGNREMYPKEGSLQNDAANNGNKVVIDDVPVGDYTVEFLLPNTDGLFDPAEKKLFHIDAADEVALNLRFFPKFASLQAFIDLHTVQTDEVVPLSVTITDPNNNVVTQSSTGQLHYTKLFPGTYDVSFGKIIGHASPENVRVTLGPGQSFGPIIGEYSRKIGYVSLQTNRPKQGWRLVRSDKELMQKNGNLSPTELGAGEGYRIEPTDLLGYGVRVVPEGIFELKEGSHIEAVIEYMQQFGFIMIDLDMLDGDTMELSFQSKGDNPSVNVSLKSVGGRVHWEDQHFPAGDYVVKYSLPDHYHPRMPDVVQVRDGVTSTIKPDFLYKRIVHLMTDQDDALFSLRNVNTNQQWQGRGVRHSFKDLPPGSYELTFSTTRSRPDLVIPEKTLVEVPRTQDVFLKSPYLSASSLEVTSNINDFEVKLEQLDGQRRSWSQNVEGGTLSLTLPIGFYRISFLPLEGDLSIRYGTNHPEAVQVELEPGKPASVHGIYDARSGSLVVTTNLPQASYTVVDITNSEKELVVGRFRGKHSVIPMTFVGQYRIDFDDVPHYQKPDSKAVIIPANERVTVGGTYTPTQALSEIPPGPAILGDVFSEGAADEQPARTVDLRGFAMSVTPVTNAQYAAWLTKAIAQSRITYVDTGAQKGQVKDHENHLLFETVIADPESQITVKRNESDQMLFLPLSGKDNFPVIEVSWFGAQMYCRENGFRLPSEAEWEKAAGIDYDKDGKIVKYRYGFGSDMIDPTVANYSEKYIKTPSRMVRTNEVGYYDGINMLKQGSQAKMELEQNPELIQESYGTRRAKSPSGLYDMSGNVREWTDDWYDAQWLKTLAADNPKGPGHGSLKVTKGGSYESFAYELRVAARMPLDPETTDAFTGFRVVADDSAVR